MRRIINYDDLENLLVKYQETHANKLTRADVKLIDSVLFEIAEPEKSNWIPVKDRMPPERDTIFAKVYGTKQWNPNMFQRSSDDVRVAVRFEDGTRMVSHDHTVDGKWRSEMEKYAYPKRKVTHWMENPELPEEEA